MPQIINPLMTQALNRYSDTQDVFSKRAKSVSDNSKTSGDPAASPSDYVAAMGKRLDLLVKQQAKINAISAISYCKVTASGQEAIKETFSAIKDLAIKNATDTTSAQERAINQQSFISKVNLLNQVNQTVGLNPGQPTTAGACTIVTAQPATAANTNGTLTFTAVNAGTGGVSIVGVITNVESDVTTKLKISSYTDGAVSAGSPASPVVTGVFNIAAAFTAVPALTGTTDLARLTDFQKLIKQNIVSSADAVKAFNLPSMVALTADYAADPRVQSTTLQSINYSNMYADISSVAGATTGTVKFTLNTGYQTLTTDDIDPTSSQKVYTFNDSSSKATDVTIDISTIANASVPVAHTVVQFGAASLSANFQTSESAAVKVDIKSLTVRSLKLDTVNIAQQSDAIIAMTTLQGIQSTILGTIANTELAVSELELTRAQLDSNIAATEEVIEAMDGLNPLEEAQAMAALDQQLQANVTIISKIISQQTMLQQSFSSLLRG